MESKKGEISFKRDPKTGHLESIQGIDITDKDVSMSLLTWVDGLNLSLIKFNQSSTRYTIALISLTVVLAILGIIQIVLIVLSINSSN